MKESIDVHYPSAAPPAPEDARDAATRYWLIWYHDASVECEVFTDEAAARNRLASASDNWACTLFVEAPPAAPADAPPPAPEDARDAARWRTLQQRIKDGYEDGVIACIAESFESLERYVDHLPPAAPADAPPPRESPSAMLDRLGFPKTAQSAEEIALQHEADDLRNIAAPPEHIATIVTETVIDLVPAAPPAPASATPLADLLEAFRVASIVLSRVPYDIDEEEVTQEYADVLARWQRTERDLVERFAALEQQLAEARTEKMALLRTNGELVAFFLKETEKLEARVPDAETVERIRKEFEWSSRENADPPTLKVLDWLAQFPDPESGRAP